MLQKSKHQPPGHHPPGHHQAPLAVPGTPQLVPPARAQAEGQQRGHGGSYGHGFAELSYDLAKELQGTGDLGDLGDLGWQLEGLDGGNLEGGNLGGWMVDVDVV